MGMLLLRSLGGGLGILDCGAIVLGALCFSSRRASLGGLFSMPEHEPNCDMLGVRLIAGRWRLPNILLSPNAHNTEFRNFKIYKCIIQTCEVSAEPRLFFIYYEQGLLQAADLLYKEEELQHRKSVLAA